VAGRIQSAGMRATLMKAVEIPNYHFNTSPTVLTVTLKRWAHNTDPKEAIIPTDVTINGKYKASGVFTRSLEVDETTRAAQVDSAREPNKSAPIPAISPTLSPTLSAIVPGLLGSSSFKSLHTFPTRSEPTSAAFV